MDQEVTRIFFFLVPRYPDDAGSGGAKLRLRKLVVREAVSSPSYQNPFSEEGFCAARRRLHAAPTPSAVPLYRRPRCLITPPCPPRRHRVSRSASALHQRACALKARPPGGGAMHGSVADRALVLLAG